MSGQEQASASFTPIAQQYDQSRNMPEAVLSRAIHQLVEAGAVQPSSRILDVGCGTGQLTLPFATHGFHMVGIDISNAMVEIARAKVEPMQDVTFSVGNAQSLEFDDGEFDHVIASKLFQHVADWQAAADEIIRVLKPDGAFLYVNDRGSFVNQVRQQFSQLADQHCYRNRYRGVIDRDELNQYFLNKGCRYEQFSSPDLQWTKSITYGQALQEFRERLFAEFWSIPDQTYIKIMEEVKMWIDAQPNGRDTIEEMHPYLLVDIYQVQLSVVARP